MPIYRYKAICSWCIHQKEEIMGNGFIRYWCDAFPMGIPEDIRTSYYDHREPYKGDNGIQFERASFDVLKDRFYFMVSDNPEELADSIDLTFQAFDELRSKGLMQPPFDNGTPFND